MVKLHARTRHVNRVIIDAKIAYQNATPDLTVGEHLMALADIMSSIAKYEIREERHGTDDKPGDLE